MKQCFVIMPIGSGDAYQVYRNRYENIIEPAVKSFLVDGEQAFQCMRADFITKTGSITRDLIGRLYRSDAVIADLTDLNPNVFYELGVRHALRPGTILIALKGTKPPFDVGDLRVIPYEDRVGGEKEAIPQIQEVLKSLLSDQKQPDSPVLLAIPELAELGPVKEQQAHFAALERERDLLKAKLEVSEKASLTNQGLLETMRGAIDRLGQQLSEPQRREAETEIESIVRAKRQATKVLRIPSLGDAAVDPDLVLIIMPFSKELQPIYDTIREAADMAGLRTYRADVISTAGSIIDAVFEAIAKSGLIVADLSGRNPNILYELGLALAMGKETLLLADDIEDLPFDIRNQRVFPYNRREVQSLKELQQRLLEAFDHYRRTRDA